MNGWTSVLYDDKHNTKVTLTTSTIVNSSECDFSFIYVCVVLCVCVYVCVCCFLRVREAVLK